MATGVSCYLRQKLVMFKLTKILVSIILVKTLILVNILGNYKFILGIQLDQDLFGLIKNILYVYYFVSFIRKLVVIDIIC